MKIIVGILVIVAIVAAVLFVSRDLEKVSVERFEITGVSDVSFSGFKLHGNLFISNPSPISVPVKSVNYDIILKETQLVVSSGALPAFMLSPGTSEVPFTHDVSWGRYLNTVIRLATQEHLYATVNGTLRVDIPGADQYDIPFSKDIDLKEAIAGQAADDAAPVTAAETTASEDKGLLGGLLS